MKYANIIKEINDSCSNWTGYDWDDPEIDALRHIVDQFEDLEAVSPEILEQAKHSQADGSYEEQQLAERSRSALRVVKSSVGSLQNALADLESIYNDLVSAIEANAEQAEAYAVEAIQHLENEDLDEAKELLSEAFALENQYGDAPTWGKAYAMVEKAIEDLEETD